MTTAGLKIIYPRSTFHWSFLCFRWPAAYTWQYYHYQTSTGLLTWVVLQNLSIILKLRLIN